MEDIKSKIADWLNTPKEERDLDAGANLMLKVNRNRILHQNVLRKRLFDKIEYELRKYAGDMPLRCSEIVVNKMEEKSGPIIELITKDSSETPGRSGKREDHDKLPDKIKAIYDENLQIYPRMREVHARLKIMTEVSKLPCDRYPFLQDLLAMDSKLRENWEQYDKFDINSEPEGENEGEGDGQIVLTLTPKQVSSCRAYLSRNKANLNKHLAEENKPKYNELLEKMNERFKQLIQSGETFDPIQIEDLRKLGLTVDV